MTTTKVSLRFHVDAAPGHGGEGWTGGPRVWRGYDPDSSGSNSPPPSNSPSDKRLFVALPFILLPFMGARARGFLPGAPPPRRPRGRDERGKGSGRRAAGTIYHSGPTPSRVL